MEDLTESRRAHRTFMGMIWNMPGGVGRGRRPVTNGHLFGPLTLAANWLLADSISRCDCVVAAGSTFGRDIMSHDER